jgi:hypothetical protein
MVSRLLAMTADQTEAVFLIKSLSPVSCSSGYELGSP